MENNGITIVALMTYRYNYIYNGIVVMIAITMTIVFYSVDTSN